MQPRNMSMSGVVDLAAVKAAQEAKVKAEQARAEAARQGGTGAVSPADLVIDVDEAGFERDVLQVHVPRLGRAGLGQKSTTSTVSPAFRPPLSSGTRSMPSARMRV